MTTRITLDEAIELAQQINALRENSWVNTPSSLHPYGKYLVSWQEAAERVIHCSSIRLDARTKKLIRLLAYNGEILDAGRVESGQLRVAAE